MIDGAMANVSPRVIARMQDVVKVTPIGLPRRIPNDRPFVEGLFGVLEELGFHRMPNTTGSNPRETRRTNPEAAAIKYWIQVEQLADVCDVMAANHNANPHSSLYNRTPLEYLSYRCESENCWPAQVDDSDLPRLLSITKTVPVRGNIYKGRRPYVNFYSARYTSAVLSHAPHPALYVVPNGDAASGEGEKHWAWPENTVRPFESLWILVQRFLWLNAIGASRLRSEIGGCDWWRIAAVAAHP